MKIFSILIFLFLYILLFYIFFKVIETMKILSAKSYNSFTPFDNDETIYDNFFKDIKYNSENNPFRLNNSHIPLSLPIDLIKNGIIEYENLSKIEKDYPWLINVLSKKGINDPNNIYSAILDEGGRVLITQKD